MKNTYTHNNSFKKNVFRLFKSLLLSLGYGAVWLSFAFKGTDAFSVLLIAGALLAAVSLILYTAEK